MFRLFRLISLFNWVLFTGGRKLRVVDGRLYRYDYVTESVTQVQGSSPTNTSLTIQAELVLHALTACEMQLQVSHGNSGRRVEKKVEERVKIDFNCEWNKLWLDKKRSTL